VTGSERSELSFLFAWDERKKTAGHCVPGTDFIAIAIILFRGFLFKMEKERTTPSCEAHATPPS
jgi:hypothetical protein